MTDDEIFRSHLWLETLAVRSDDADEKARTKLRASFVEARKRAAFIASRIPPDEPGMTDHSLDHLDALWELASEVSPEGYLTPAEGWMFGIAALVHDLGMTTAAYPGGRTEVEALPEFAAALSRLVSCRDESPLGDDETGTPEERRAALAIVLRELHAPRAELLSTQSWPGPEGTAVHLIDDVELRVDLGPTAGRIGASHWWAVADLPILGRPLAPAWLPRGWSIDLVKVAALLRIADAAHIDSRRAPHFAHAIERPRGVSAVHWAAQRKVQRPRTADDRVEITSRPFPAEESDAW